MKLPMLLRLFVTASLALGVQFVAQAHTALKEATPAADAVVTVLPEKINLLFTEPVKFVKLQLMGVGHEMPTNFAPNAEAQAEFSFETPGMHPGTFTVNWAVVGKDGHAVNNSYSFTVDPTANAAAAR